jgi:hypothetical protein
MPNCDFFATGDDHAKVLAFVFDELPVRVFESFSETGHDIREFRKPSEILDEPSLWSEANTALLELWPTAASSNVVRSRINLGTLGYGEGPFRFRLEGWGLIQLHLGTRDGARILSSHTNHNSEARALRSKTTGQPQLGHPNAWNWVEVARVSNKLNRHLRKEAVSKLGSRLVLPEAHAAIRDGCHAV